MTIEIPLSLLRSIENGNCVLFLGAGIGRHLITNGQPIPTGKQLAQELCAKFSFPESDDLPLVSSAVEIEKGRKELESFIGKRFADAQPDGDLQWLLAQRWKSIYTTNYDEGIKRAFELNSHLKQRPEIFSLSKDVVSYDPRVSVPIIHLHGAIYGEHKTSLVITSNDFITYKEKRRMLFDLLKHDAATSTILYVGYSNKDPNWNVLIKELQDDFFPSSLPSSFRVDPFIGELEKRVLDASGLQTVQTDLNGFVNGLKATLSPPVDVDALKGLKQGIPTDFHRSFEQSPAATLRLLKCWTYVNQAPFDNKQNLVSFLKGDKPNWALMGGGSYFERDLEEKVYDDCLDYITSPSPRPTIASVFAPAGYGTTTLLMALAVRLVRQKAAAIFYLNEAAELNEGDVEFATEATDETCIFVIDNASHHKYKIQNILHRFREKKKPLLLILGSRKNEWHQAGAAKVGGIEYAIDPLSEEEINKLLTFLRQHSSLGILENLAQDLQIAAIKNKLGKELLVTMREATEGKAFDAILEDEYRKISNDGAQKIYLMVSCFYQFGSILRTGLLAKICDINETKLHPLLNTHLEGVVVHEDIDVSRGIYGVRPRHRKIAEIVWERCGDPKLREDILQKSLENLNLTHRSDRDAFDNFVQADHLIDLISSLDNKIRFFETASRKDPDNPYIWQHFARMFTREKRYEMALDQIEKAIVLDSNRRILYHTKGEILAQIAYSAESMDIARKRLIQSEAAFQTGLKLKPNDEYCLHGLASLYFNWAKRLSETDTDESSEYLSKAEKEISEGIKIASYKEHLWILSSHIADYVGDSPNHILSLQKAISSTSGAFLSRYLLGRTYRRKGKYQDALDVLTPAFKSNTDNFRIALECGECYLGLGKTYSEAIALLNIASLHGMKDPRFIAMLSGLYYLNEQYSEADKILSEATKQSFSYEERRTAYFKPPSKQNADIPFSVSGRATRVGKGLAWIEVTGRPRNLPCPGSKWGSMVLLPDMPVECELVFNAEGPLAVNPREASNKLF